MTTLKIGIINRKQTFPIQSSTETNPELGISVMEESLKSNIGILQGFQCKILRIILCASRNINNHRLYKDLEMDAVFSETNKWSSKSY
jgi:hypothetical protein